MQISIVFCIVGWLTVYFSTVRFKNQIYQDNIDHASSFSMCQYQEAYLLNIGRFCTDYDICILSYVVLVFITEIAPKNLRGRLRTLNQLMIICGSSFSYMLGTLVSWRTLTLTEYKKYATVDEDKRNNPNSIASQEKWEALCDHFNSNDFKGKTSSWTCHMSNSVYCYSKRTFVQIHS